MDQLYETLKKIISETMQINAEEIHMDSDLIHDLQIDSLGCCELSYALEDELNIKIPDRDIDGFVTVKDVYDCLNKLI